MSSGEDFGTWWAPTLAGVRDAYENGDFDYRTAPSIGALLDEIDRLAGESDHDDSDDANDQG